MEVSYSKLLARYQSRNGSWFAVNRKHKVKQKRVKRWFRGNADRVLSMKLILHVCWTQAKQTHVFSVTMTNDESLDIREGTCSP